MVGIDGYKLLQEDNVTLSANDDPLWDFHLGDQSSEDLMENESNFGNNEECDFLFIYPIYNLKNHNQTQFICLLRCH